jgi:hypothetical protein
MRFPGIWEFSGENWFCAINECLFWGTFWFCAMNECPLVFLATGDKYWKLHSFTKRALSVGKRSLLAGRVRAPPASAHAFTPPGWDRGCWFAGYLRYYWYPLSGPREKYRVKENRMWTAAEIRTANLSLRSPAPPSLQQLSINEIREKSAQRTP